MGRIHPDKSCEQSFGLLQPMPLDGERFGLALFSELIDRLCECVKGFLDHAQIGITPPQRFDKARSCRKLAFFFEGLGDLDLLEEEGGEGGLEDHESAFVFALFGVGVADLEDLCEGQFGIGETVFEDLEAFDQGVVGATFEGDRKQGACGVLERISVKRVAFKQRAQVLFGGFEASRRKVQHPDGVIFVGRETPLGARLLSLRKDREFRRTAKAQALGDGEAADAGVSLVELPGMDAAKLVADRVMSAAAWVEEETDLAAFDAVMPVA